MITTSTKNPFASESEIGFLTEWLAGPGRTTYKRWIQDLQKRCRPLKFTGGARQDSQARQRVNALLSDLKELVRLGAYDWQRFKTLGELINTRLARYRYTPWLALDRPMVWTAKMNPLPAEYGVFFWSSQPYRSKTPLQELHALRVLQALVENDWLEILRPCAQCSRWFVARKPWAKLCGAAGCRAAAKRAYQTSEAYKKKRRKNP